LEALRELARVVAGLTAAQYMARPEGFRGSIGEHVRHCLDHVAALDAGRATGRIDYDRRRRGTAIETDRAAALREIRRLADRLGGLEPAVLARPVAVAEAHAVGCGPVDLQSSLGRELAFVVSHTTHHNALVAALARALGGRVPEQFGYARSTLAWQEQTACAR
jgi:uncharacterized damage-inducible protein DinB